MLPRSKAAIETVIASLKHAKKGSANAELAAVLSSIVASPTGVKGLTSYRFQAIALAPTRPRPCPAEVSLAIVNTSIAYGKSRAVRARRASTPTRSRQTRARTSMRRRR